jgi:alpha-D-xyloside xylohydrolase
VPWIYDDEAVDVLRFFTKLKCRLMPYLYAAAAEAVRSGAPMMRAMVLEYPDDPACETLDRQYMLGPSLLVAPVFSEGGEVMFYLPEGRWTHLLTGEVVDGGRWRTEKHGFMSLPLYARANSLIAWGGRDDRPDYDFADGAVFAAYALDERAQASASTVDASGSEILQLSVRRDGATIDATASAHDRTWSLRLPAGMRAMRTEGDVLAIDEGATHFEVTARGSVRIACTSA